MNTTQEKKDAFINSGSEIALDLLKIFGFNDHIVIADIGACDGLSTIVYSKLFPNSSIIAFEPIPGNYDEMISNFRQYGINNRLLYAMPIALSDKRETLKMWRSQGEAPGITGWNTGNKSSSILKPTGHIKAHPWCGFVNDIQVEAYRLDDLQKSMNTKIDFAHIDVQGAELKVLKGGKNTFKKTKAIWIEVATQELYENQPLKHDIQRWMSSIGMRCVKDTCTNKYGDMLWRR